MCHLDKALHAHRSAFISERQARGRKKTLKLNKRKNDILKENGISSSICKAFCVFLWPCIECPPPSRHPSMSAPGISPVWFQVTLPLSSTFRLPNGDTDQASVCSIENSYVLMFIQNPPPLHPPTPSARCDVIMT